MTVKRTVGILLSMIAVTALTACVPVSPVNQSAAQPAPEEKKTLHIGIELAYPPFDYKDENGEPTGVDVDLIKDFGTEYGYDIVIDDTSWDGLIPALQTGKADAVISAMSITEERDKLVDFSDAYALAKIAILASAGSKAETDADFDSPEITIAVKSGTVGHIYAEEFFPQATLTVLSDESACINEVLQGKADGFIYDELTCTNYHDDNPDKTKCISLSHAETGGWGIAVAEGNTELTDQLNAFIKDYYQSGKLDELGEKYMPGKKQEFEENGFQWFFDLDEQY
ncbi:MAG: transporter substrate-binding domain-containing protein [Lachnospiraceae bacterium]|nr:transporter substrate-binding domain-containing protein [Lachnospiraceae bacterium]